MQVIGVAGLPGSGKSDLMKQLEARGYSRYDDINRDWNANLPKARINAQQRNNVAISDIMFCDESWRQRLEQELAVPVTWVFFANDAWQCARNCLYRFMFQKPYRPLEDEIRKIQQLTQAYRPLGDVRPVVRADAQTVQH